MRKCPDEWSRVDCNWIKRLQCSFFGINSYFKAGILGHELVIVEYTLYGNFEMSKNFAYSQFKKRIERHKLCVMLACVVCELGIEFEFFFFFNLTPNTSQKNLSLEFAWISERASRDGRGVLVYSSEPSEFSRAPPFLIKNVHTLFIVATT